MMASARKGTKTSLPSLMKVTGNARYDCIVCFACGPDAAEIMWKYSIKYHWAIDLCCLRCSKKWVVCHSCKFIRSPLSSYSISRHNRLKHSFEKSSSQPNLQTVNSDIVEDSTSQILPVLNSANNGEDIRSEGIFHLMDDDNATDKEYISFGNPSSD